MILMTSDVSSIAESLSRWELAEYASCAFVMIACAGEYIADFTNWFTDGERERKDKLAKRSTLLLITALALELTCLVETNILSGLLIGSLAEVAGQAAEKSQTALSNSGDALNDSSAAKTSSGIALGQSAKAKASAFKAFGLASDARREADSFSAQIEGEKVELSQIRAHRTLVDAPGLLATLEPFKGTEYVFTSVFPDEEAIELLKTIDTLLQKAGWTRGNSLGGFPALDIYGNKELVVPNGFGIGLKLSVSSLSATHIESIPLNKLPKYLQAVVALHQGIDLHLFPSQPLTKAKVEEGPASAIRIEVGRKP